MLIDLDTKYNTFTLDPNDRSKVPIVVDTMDNVFESKFAAAPDRAYVVHKNKMAYIGRHLGQQMKKGVSMTEELRKWIELNSSKITEPKPWCFN